MEPGQTAEDEELFEPFRTFVQEPSRENYLAVRAIIVRWDGYRPYSLSSKAMWEALGRQEIDKVFELFRESYPGLLLSPAAHRSMSMAHRSRGAQEESGFAWGVGARCLQGLLATGDGTAHRPYVVTLLGDEYELLRHLEKEAESQRLEEIEGEWYDVLELTDGGEVHFNVTDLLATVAPGIREWRP